MIRQEWVVLFRYVRAMFPQQKFDEYTPEAWYDVLGQYDAREVRAAIAACAAESPFVSPAEIVAAVRAHRQDVDRDLQGPGQYAAVPDADPDDVPAYLAAVRDQRSRAARGEQLTARPVLAIAAGVGQALPGELDKVRRPGVLGVRCDTCHAAVGRRCKTPGKKPRGPHVARIDASRAA
ncbi:hypothetical protein [Kitasatospora sp. NPDC059571]|uniref:zinc finger domain-containing protein n=1 Tax=Kitasatospora sp. NPDC059571 TaxID=3346871 RepID=UPI0036970033